MHLEAEVLDLTTAWIERYRRQAGERYRRLDDVLRSMPDGVALEKLVLQDLGNGRTRLTSTSLVDSFAGRDALVAGGMGVGVREGCERLDEVLARG